MDKSCEPIYRRTDGTYIIRGPAGEYACAPRVVNPDGYASQEDVEAYLAKHPDALIPEPLLPAPTADELAAIARASRNAALAEHDTLVRIALRDQRAGDAVAMARLEALDAYAKALCDWPSTPGFPDIATMPKLESN